MMIRIQNSEWVGIWVGDNNKNKDECRAGYNTITNLINEFAAKQRTSKLSPTPAIALELAIVEHVHVDGIKL